MADTIMISEVWDQMVTEMIADAPLIALLGTQTVSAHKPIFDEWPEYITPVFPILVYEVKRLNPQDVGYYQTGIYRPDIEIHIYGTARNVNRNIGNHLEKTYSIPMRRATAIQTTDWRISQMLMTDFVDVGSAVVLDTQEHVWHHTSTWSTRVTKRGLAS